MNQQETSRHSVLMRAVNDRVFEFLSELGSEDGKDGEFIRECSDTNCTQTIQLTLRAYAVLRHSRIGHR